MRIYEYYFEQVSTEFLRPQVTICVVAKGAWGKQSAGAFVTRRFFRESHSRCRRASGPAGRAGRSCQPGTVKNAGKATPDCHQIVAGEGLTIIGNGA